MTAYRNEDWRDAVTLWMKTAVQSPNKPRPTYSLASAYRDAGKFEEARKYYIRVLDMDDEDYKRAALTDIAAIDIAEGRDIDGARLIGAMKAPSESDLSNFAVVLLRNDMAKDAVRLLSGISNPAPGTEEVLAEAYRLTGDCVRAQPLYDAASRWGFPAVECR